MSAPCMACGGCELLSVAAIPSVPVHANVLSDSAEAARAIPRAGIDLKLCVNCGHLFNASFKPELLRYDGAYENSLHGSRLFQAYLERLAADLASRNKLAGKQVVEVGCGDGRFLELLVDTGARAGIGYDPGARAVSRAPGVAVHARPYVAGTDAKGDLVASRHVLEHMADPAAFVDLLAAGRTDDRAVVYVEVPNGGATLTGAMIWDLIYEHCSYFSARSLARLMVARGLTDADVRTVYQGQFLAIEARAGGDGQAAVGTQIDAPAEEARLAQVFANQFWAAVNGWQAAIQSLGNAGQRLVVWGAGSKGVTFANLVDPGGSGIAAFVDLNPLKAGRFVAGTGHAVVAPEALLALKPDVVVLMNAIYRQEVADRLSGVGIAPQLVAVDDKPPRPAAPLSGADRVSGVSNSA